MMSINSANKPKKGRPPVDTEAVNVRFPREALEGIDDFRRRRHDVPTRPEAIRRLCHIGLAVSTRLGMVEGLASNSAKTTNRLIIELTRIAKEQPIEALAPFSKCVELALVLAGDNVNLIRELSRIQAFVRAVENEVGSSVPDEHDDDPVIAIERLKERLYDVMAEDRDGGDSAGNPVPAPEG